MSNLQVNETLQYTPDVGETANLIRRLSERVNRLEEMLEQRNTNAVVVPNAATATADTLALRDGSGGIAFAALASTTFAASSNATVGGTLGVTGNTTISTASVSGTISSTKSGGSSSAGFYVSAASPGIGFQATGGGTDAKRWDMVANATTLSIRAINDAESSVTTPMVITRSGTTISSVTFTATTIAATGNMTVSGTATVTGLLTGSAGLRSRGTPGGSADFTLDMTNNSTTFAVANNGVQDMFGSNAFGGLLLIHDSATDGKGAAILCMGTSLILLGGDAIYTVNASGTASKVNVYISASKINLENKTGASRTFAVMSFRTRTTL